LPAAVASPPATYPTVAPAEEEEAVLGTGDVFDIVIFNGSKESRATYRLDAHGRVSVQHIGEVEVVGRRPGELAKEIRDRLADGYLRDPIVSITVSEVNSRRLSVSGEVTKDGTIRFVPGMTIIDAIAQAGGFTPMAKKNHVKVTRVIEGKEQTFTIPVEAIQDGERPNFPVAAGDRVFVPERVF
jgi:polysaccharide export outer membrane protein